MSKLTASIYAVVIVVASLAAVSAFLAAAAGLGYATHRIFPAVDVGAGAITAAVALGTMVLVFFHPNKRPAISIPQEIFDQIAEEGEMDLDDDDDEGIKERGGDPGFIRRIESTPKRSRRRRRSSDR